MEKTITVEMAAKMMRKDANWIRFGIVSGYLPIGIATRKGEHVTDIKKISSRFGRINYYISPKLFEEFTGIDIEKENTPDGKT